MVRAAGISMSDCALLRDETLAHFMTRAVFNPVFRNQDDQRLDSRNSLQTPRSLVP